MSQEFGSSSAIDPQTISQIKFKIETCKIFLISKIKCRACKQAKALLNMVCSETGNIPSFFEVDHYPEQCRNVIMKYLSTETGVTTVPQIWINGRFIGGNDDVQRLHQEGRLVPLLGRGSRRSHASGVPSFSKCMAPTLRISSINAHLTEPIWNNTKPTLQTRESIKGQNRGGRRSIFSRSSSRILDENANQDMQPKLPRARSLSNSENLLENTHARQTSWNFLEPSVRKARSLPPTVKGRISQSNWVSDKEILCRPSIMHKPGGSGLTRRKDGSAYAIVSGLI
jgi:glutaredoxin 3